jgi:hypothetical protein
VDDVRQFRIDHPDHARSPFKGLMVNSQSRS